MITILFWGAAIWVCFQFGVLGGLSILFMAYIVDQMACDRDKKLREEVEELKDRLDKLDGSNKRSYTYFSEE